MGAKTIKLQSATKLLRHCTQIGWLQGTKESIPMAWRGWGGKALHVFSCFEVSKDQFRQFDFFLQV